MAREILLDPVTHPDHLEQKYAYRIEREVLDPLRESMERHVFSALEEMRDEIEERAERGDAGDWTGYQIDSLEENLRRVSERFDRAIVEYEGQRTEAEMRRLAEEMGADVEEYNAARNARVFSQLLGVSPTWNDDAVEARLDGAVRRNTSLITKMPREVSGRIRTDVLEQLRKGRRWEEVIATVREKLGVGAYRGELIARDQIGKVNGDLNRIRQQQMGLVRYTWTTAGDERVRNSHAVKNGRVYRWNDPPADTGHPGDDIQCRCHARGHIEDVIPGAAGVRGDSIRHDRTEVEPSVPVPDTLDVETMSVEELVEWRDRMRGTLSHIRRSEADPFGPEAEGRAQTILAAVTSELRDRPDLQPLDAPPAPDRTADRMSRPKANMFAAEGEITEPVFVAVDDLEDLADGIALEERDVWGTEVVALYLDRGAAKATGLVAEARVQTRRPLETTREFWAGESTRPEHWRVYNALDKSPLSATVSDLVSGARVAGYDAIITRTPDGSRGIVWTFDTARVALVDP